MRRILGTEAVKRFLVTVFLLLVMAVACGSGEAETVDVVVTAAEIVTEQDVTAAALSTAIAASAEPPYDPVGLRADLAAAVSLWNSQEIQQYEVTVRTAQPTWNTQIVMLTVVDGVVVDSRHTCFPERDCVLQDVDPETLTVEALLETAEFILGLNDPETQMTFNQTYGYPNALGYPGGGSWVLDGFRVLEDE